MARLQKQRSIAATKSALLLDVLTSDAGVEGEGPGEERASIIPDIALVWRVVDFDRWEFFRASSSVVARARCKAERARRSCATNLWERAILGMLSRHIVRESASSENFEEVIVIQWCQRLRSSRLGLSVEGTSSSACRGGVEVLRTLLLAAEERVL